MARFCVGLDIGTSFCKVGVWRGNHVDLVADEEGNFEMPSYVGYAGADLLTGEGAKYEALSNPSNTFFATKR